MTINNITWQAYDQCWPPARIYEATYKGIRAIARGGRTADGKQGYSIEFAQSHPVKSVAEDLVVLDGLNEALKQGGERLKEVARDHGLGAAK